MSCTEQQKAYHLKKMRTRVARLDANQNGVVSREDFEVMSSRLSKYSNLSDEQTKKVHVGFMKIADVIGLKDGGEFEVKAYACTLSDVLLSKTPEEAKEMVQYSHSPVFDVIDTNSNGQISVEEFKVYLKVVAPDVTEDEAKHAFDVIDADKNGEISREEFFTAAEDFFFGKDETEVSRVFWGKLLD